MEKRSQLEIVEDISSANADVVRSRLVGIRHLGEISVESGRAVYDEARNLILAAACAALEKKAVFPKRKPEQALQYLARARFGIPQPGSYIMKIISPVGPKLDRETDLFGVVYSEEPFERKTVRTLSEALLAMQTASQEMALTGKFEPMQAAVEKGVSANMCEAIVGLHAGGGERGVELTFSWSPLRGAPLNSVQDVAISPDAIPIISEAARIFRQTETVNNSEVIGVEYMTDDSSEAEGLWEPLLAFDCVKEVVVLDEPELGQRVMPVFSEFRKRLETLPRWQL